MRVMYERCCRLSLNNSKSVEFKALFKSYNSFRAWLYITLRLLKMVISVSLSVEQSYIQASKSLEDWKVGIPPSYPCPPRDHSLPTSSSPLWVDREGAQSLISPSTLGDSSAVPGKQSEKENPAAWLPLLRKGEGFPFPAYFPRTVLAAPGELEDVCVGWGEVSSDLGCWGRRRTVGQFGPSGDGKPNLSQQEREGLQDVTLICSSEWPCRVSKDHK